MAQQIYEQWFRIADEDKDGAVGGAEAVRFFMRSGLQQAVLGQIWELSSGGGPKLNQFQFSSAMRLVALAQASGGQLPIEQARAVVAGVGPNLPPPTLQGLEVPGSAGPAARPAGPAPGTLPYAPQVTGGMPYAPQATGGMPYAPQVTGAMPYAPQVTGAMPAAPPYTMQPTGGVAPPQPTYSAQYTGASVAGMGPAAAAPASGSFPPLAPTDLQRYQASFAQLDADRDGFVTGGECFGFFLQSGLDKAVLRDVWTLVAGAEGRLSQQQFVASMYLQELAKRGAPLPKQLPPGLAGFPPVAATVTATATATWSLQSQFGTSSNIAAAMAAPPVTSPAMVAPPPPAALPPRVDFASLGGVAPPTAAGERPSAVPAVPATLLAGVSAMDRTKLQEEQQVCEAKEKALQTAEERAAETRARQQQLNSVLQELVVFRNRTEVALLTSQDQARRLEEELEATKKRYDAAYSAAQAASEKSAAVHNRVMELMTAKAETEDKMRRLEGEIAAAERMGPADVARLEAELADLGARVAAAEASRNAKLGKVEALRKQQESLSAQLATLKEADADAGRDVAAAQGELDSLAKELQDARSSGVVAAVPGLLSRAAAVYRGLYGIAQRGGGGAAALPLDALPAALSGLHVWSDEVAAGVLDWPDDDVDARGFITVNALPGADAPRPIIKAAKPPPTPSAPAPAPAAPGAPAAADPAPAEPAAPAAAPAAKAPLPDDFASGDFGDAPAFGDPPAFGSGALNTALSGATSGAVAVPAATEAPAAPAPPAPLQPFGDDAFGSPPAFTSPTAASAAAAAATAASPLRDGDSSMLPGADSGALADNPFASGTVPALASLGGSGGAGQAGSGAIAAAAAAAEAAAPAAFGFGDREDGSTVPAVPPPVAPVPAADPAASGSAFGFVEDNAFGDSDSAFPPPPPPAGASESAGGAPPQASAAPAVVTGFDDNAFGDSAFGAPAVALAPAGSAGGAAPAAAPAPAAADKPAASGFGFEDNAFA